MSKRRHRSLNLHTFQSCPGPITGELPERSNRDEHFFFGCRLLIASLLGFDSMCPNCTLIKWTNAQV
jgi:hypothetical protein